jgi:hypothetical protein
MTKDRISSPLLQDGFCHHNKWPLPTQKSTWASAQDCCWQRGAPAGILALSENAKALAIALSIPQKMREDQE